MMIVSCDGPQHDVSFLPIHFLQDLMPSCCSLPDRLFDVNSLCYDDAEDDDAAVDQHDVALINHYVAESYLLLKEKTDHCCFVVVKKKKKPSVMRMTNWCAKKRIVF